MKPVFQDMLGDFQNASSLSPQEREEAARGLIEKCGYAAAALTIIPIPATEYVAVIPLHVAMVVGVGHLHGEELSKDSAGELILRIGATAGLSLMGSRLAITAGKVLLPGLGGLLGAPFMYASTISIGTVARIYFQRQGKMSDEEIKELYKDALKRARKDFDPKRARDSKVQDLAKAAAAESSSGPNPVVTPEPAPAPAAEEDPVARLERLKGLLDKGLIEPHEYDAVKKKILDGI